MNAQWLERRQKAKEIDEMMKALRNLIAKSREIRKSQVEQQPISDKTFMMSKNSEHSMWSVQEIDDRNNDFDNLQSEPIRVKMLKEAARLEPIRKSDYLHEQTEVRFQSLSVRPSSTLISGSRFAAIPIVSTRIQNESCMETQRTDYCLNNSKWPSVSNYVMIDPKDIGMVVRMKDNEIAVLCQIDQINEAPSKAQQKEKNDEQHEPRTIKERLRARDGRNQKKCRFCDTPYTYEKRLRDHEERCASRRN